MKLSALKVLELNQNYKLVEGLSDRELKNPEGIDLDLRVGRVEKIIGPSFLGVDDRSSAIVELVGDIEKNGNQRITIKPGDYFLVRTIETINCPGKKVKYDNNFPSGYLIPSVAPRVSLQKGGLSLDCSTTNPGYSGQLIFGLSNNGKYDFEFELGARMFKIYWEPVIGEIKRAYTGQHQGGRMTSQGELEVQT